MEMGVAHPGDDDAGIALLGMSPGAKLVGIADRDHGVSVNEYGVSAHSIGRPHGVGADQAAHLHSGGHNGDLVISSGRASPR